MKTFTYDDKTFDLQKATPEEIEGALPAGDKVVLFKDTLGTLKAFFHYTRPLSIVRREVADMLDRCIEGTALTRNDITVSVSTGNTDLTPFILEVTS